MHLHALGQQVGSGFVADLVQQRENAAGGAYDGFLALHQRELQAAVAVPVWTSRTSSSATDTCPAATLASRSRRSRPATRLRAVAAAVDTRWAIGAGSRGSRRCGLTGA